MHHHNLDLTIWRSGGEFAVKVKAECRLVEDRNPSEDRREVVGHGESPPSPVMLDRDELQRDQALVEADRASPEVLRNLGTLLYRYLFSSPIERQLQQCVGYAKGREEGVRVRLRISSDAPEIAALPWEFAFDALAAERGEAGFLAASVRTPLVRYLDTGRPVGLDTELPLRMLVVIPAYTGLDTASEEASLLAAIRELQASGRLSVRMLRGPGDATRERIVDALNEEETHVLHFIGHGRFTGDAACLLLNDDAGGTDEVDDRWWSTVLSACPGLKLVVLNACEGAKTSATRPFVGLAPALVHVGIPAVVAMQYWITDDEAKSFAHRFYHSLLNGPNLGRVDLAVALARNELLAKYPDGPAVGVPVLYMRSPRGVLFSLPEHKSLVRLLNPRAVITAREINRTRDYNSDVAGDPALGAEERARRRELEGAIRLRNAGLSVAFGVALVGFFLLWMGVFDWLPRQLKPEFYTVLLADGSSRKSLDDAVTLVAITDTTEESLGRPFDASWRAHHATLIDRLSLAGAAVVAFDVYFPEAAGEDTVFAGAIDRARGRGTRVVVGVKDRDPNGEIALTPTIGRSVTAWGSLCIGRTVRYPANVFPVLGRFADDSTRFVPSLALQTVTSYLGGASFDFDTANRQVNVLDPAGRAIRRVGVTEVSTAGRSAACSVIRSGDRVADMVLDYTPLDALRARRHRYEDLVVPIEPSSLASFRDKIVLVGIELSRSDERFSIWRGLGREYRFGYELHADAINTMLRGITIRSLAYPWQFLLILVLALVGALLARARVPGGRAGRLGALAAVLLAYMLAAFALYTTAHLLLNALYHVLAFLCSYGWVRHLKPRYFP